MKTQKWDLLISLLKYNRPLFKLNHLSTWKRTWGFFLFPLLTFSYSVNTTKRTSDTRNWAGNRRLPNIKESNLRKTHRSILLPSMPTHHPKVCSRTLNPPTSKTMDGSWGMRRCRPVRQAALQAIQLPPHELFLTLAMKLLQALWAISFDFYIGLCLDHSLFKQFLQHGKAVSCFPFLAISPKTASHLLTYKLIW